MSVQCQQNLLRIAINDNELLTCKRGLIQLNSEVAPSESNPQQNIF